MSSADWSLCNFNKGIIYKNGYCGYWVSASAGDIVGATEDSNCNNYTANVAGCCGGPFDPCPDNPDCCGYQRCLEYHNAQGNPVPLDVTGYSATSGSAGSSWTASVFNVSISAPTFYNGTYADFHYKVSGAILVSWTADPSGTIDCDGNARPPTALVPFQFWIVHDEVLGCPDTAVANSYANPCDITVQVCPGTTTTTGGGFTACDVLEANYSGSPTMLSSKPDFNNDCEPPQTTYQVRVPMKVTMLQNIGNPNGCSPGCTSTAWHGRYFPDTSAVFTLSIVGVWRF